MRKSFFAIMLLSLAGCKIQFGDCWGTSAKYERTVEMSAPFTVGSVLIAGTSRGSISITGADVTKCSLKAVITGWAESDEQAQNLAEQVQIKLEPAGEKLIVKIERPDSIKCGSVGVSLDITVPQQSNIQCSDHRGSIELVNIKGDVKGKASRGSITARDIEGSVRLNTSRGSIVCKGVSGGDIELVTSRGNIDLARASADSLKLQLHRGRIGVSETSANTANISSSRCHVNCREVKFAELTAKSSRGNIDITYSASSPGDITAKMVASRGSINLVTPPTFAGQVDFSAERGSVNTALPVTVTGQIDKRIKGTIGQGNGRLKLQTSRGSIKVK